jgi:hypothetical protein
MTSEVNNEQNLLKSAIAEEHHFHTPHFPSFSNTVATIMAKKVSQQHRIMVHHATKQILGRRYGICSTHPGESAPVTQSPQRAD